MDAKPTQPLSAAPPDSPDNGAGPAMLMVNRSLKVVWMSPPARYWLERASGVPGPAAATLGGIPALAGLEDRVAAVLTGQAPGPDSPAACRLEDLRIEPCLSPDGDVLGAVVSFRPDRPGEGPCPAAPGRDQLRMTLRRREAYLQRLSRLLETSQMVLAQSDIPGLLQSVVDAARQVTGARLATCSHNYTDGEFRVGAASNAPDVQPCPKGDTFKVKKGGVYLELLGNSDCLRLTQEELVNHPAWWGLPPEHAPLRGLLGVGLQDHRGEVRGMIMVSDKTEGEFTEEDETLLRQLGAITSLAMRHIEARARAEEEAKTLEAILDHLPEGLTICDREGRVIRMSQWGRRFMGLTAEEIQSLHPGKQAEMFRVRRADTLEPAIWEELPISRAVRLGQTIRNEEWVMISPQGDKCTILSNAGPILDSEGRRIGAIAAWRDSTEMKAKESALRQANLRLAAGAKELRRANEELSLFAHTASHDLKAPLRAIGNYVKFLREDLEERLEEEDRQYLEAMDQAVRQGVRLVDDLLRLAHLNRPPDLLDQVDPGELAAEAAAGLHLPGSVLLEIAPGFPTLRTDTGLLKQIIANLLENAVKFNTSPTPRLKVGWRRPPDGEPDGRVEIFVSDNGIGIADRHQKMIFGVFQRLHPEERYPGTGMGLALVKKGVERLGGSVRVESEEGRGSTFILSLPLGGGREEE